MLIVMVSLFSCGEEVVLPDYSGVTYEAVEINGSDNGRMSGCDPEVYTEEYCTANPEDSCCVLGVIGDSYFEYYHDKDGGHLIWQGKNDGLSTATVEFYGEYEGEKTLIAKFEMVLYGNYTFTYRDDYSWID